MIGGAWPDAFAVGRVQPGHATEKGLVLSFDAGQAAAREGNRLGRCSKLGLFGQQVIDLGIQVRQEGAAGGAGIFWKRAGPPASGMAVGLASDLSDGAGAAAEARPVRV